MNSRFHGELVLRYLKPEELKRHGLSGQHWEVVYPFSYHSALHGLITLHPGSFTDLASIPRLAKPYIDAEDPSIGRPAAIHDKLYQNGGFSGDRYLTRREADAVLREAMLASGARWTQAQLVYGMVRAFGWLFWKGNRDHED